MKQKLLAIICLVLLLFMTSCQFGYDNWPVEKTYILSSADLFVVNGKAYTSYSGHFPLNIYNPNDYTIMVKIKNKEYILAPFVELAFDCGGKQMGEE